MNSLFKLKMFFLFLPALSILSADHESSCFSQPFLQTPLCYVSQPLVEIKTGYFFFSNSKMREVYDNGGWDIQLCTSYPLWNLSRGWTLAAYGAVEYLHTSGQSINGNQKTSLWSIPVNIGLKPSYAIDANKQYYFAIGPRYFYLHQHNRSTYVYENKSRNGLGFFVNTGFNYILCNHLVIDIFGEYSYAKTHFHAGESPTNYTRNIQVGGFTFGAGIGYEF